MVNAQFIFRMVLVQLICIVCLSRPAAGQTFTHYATPAGSSTSLCVLPSPSDPDGDPCNLWRAIDLANNGLLPQRSVVRLEAGQGPFSHGALTLSGHGITFVGDGGQARLAGGREFRGSSAWTKTAGFTYVYETPIATWAGDKTVGQVVQQLPVSNWTPLLVDDRVPPFTVSLGRPFTLTIPPAYKNVWVSGQSLSAGLALVDAQGGTFRYDSVSGKTYVHLYRDDSAPTDSDNLYLAPSGWGSLTISGDHNSFVNFSIEQASLFTTLKSAAGTTLANFDARSTPVWLRGSGTATDLFIDNVIAQMGTTDPECYDANPNLSVGECWNTATSVGKRALLLGEENVPTVSGWVIDGWRVERGWNGVKIDGHNHTVKNGSCWGMANHCFEGSGFDNELLNNTAANSQDSIFIGRNPFGRWKIEGNFLPGGAYIVTSDDGTGGTESDDWSFKYNVTSRLTTDAWTFAKLTSDCNIYMANNQLMRVIATNGAPASNWYSIAEIQANTPHEAGSRSYPYGDWTSGKFFDNFSTQTDPSINLGDPLKVCGKRVGP